MNINKLRIIWNDGEMTDEYTCFPELVTVPYPNQNLKTNFSKTTRPKLKVKLYSDRAWLTL